VDESGNDNLASYYDLLPYKSHAFPQTTPEHLASVAHLFCLDAPDISHARVLELGSAAGGNLIPFAARFPNAKVVGVDLSRVQIEDGKQAIARAGLSNIELHHMDLSTIDITFGKFDFIICHGVYSWVPAHVQEAILRISRQNLTETGLAYVSYNTYPGWKSREIVRDAMMLRACTRPPEERLPYAQGMLDFLEATAPSGSPLRVALDDIRPIMASGNTSYLQHEFLEPYNSPCYFRDFIARAETAGLSYLAEADLPVMFVQNYGDAISAPLRRELGHNQVDIEQYLDFVTNRTFRQTILTHQARQDSIRRRLTPERIGSLQFAGAFRAEGTVTTDSSSQEFSTLRNGSVWMSEPLCKAAAAELDAIYPAMLTPEELGTRAAKRLGVDPQAAQQGVSLFLEQMLITGRICVRRDPPSIALQIPDRPFISAAVREALVTPAGAGTSLGCNLFHQETALSAIEVRVAKLLDGTRDRGAVIQGIVEDAKTGVLTFMDGATPVTGSKAVEAAARKHVPAVLESLRRKGFISGK